MSLRAVKSPLAPKMTMVQGSTALRPESRRQVSNSSTWSVCSIEPDNGEQVAEIQQIFLSLGAQSSSSARSLKAVAKVGGAENFVGSLGRNLCRKGTKSFVPCPVYSLRKQ